MTPVQLVIFLAGLYLSFFLLEHVFRLRRWSASLAARIAVNLGASALAFVAAAILVWPASAAALRWTDAAAFGLMPMLGLPAAAEFALTFLLLDLTFYYWHVANHRVAFLWRFHVVHHVDPDLDVTTGLRFHFVEVAFSALLRVVQVAVIGPGAAAYAIYEAFFQAHTLFHHSNLRLPAAIERAINLAVVTPRMHGIHHSHVRDETNSNFGIVFSWWDRIHRTLRLAVPQERIVIGIPGYSLPGDNRLGHLLAMPFKTQREYWKPPSQSRRNPEA